MHIAVDLGAGSGRVFLIAFDPDELFLEEIHRFVYPPRKISGHLRWDFGSIFREIKSGLSDCAKRAKELRHEIASLGVDSWAVDYGWIDEEGHLLDDPICYRDDRTNGMPEVLFEKLPRRVIFEKTGIQTQRFNTIFQLSADNDVTKRKGKLFLLLPDLIHYELTGRCFAEFTNATTTQLVDAGSRTWDHELLTLAGVDVPSAPELIEAGTEVGDLKPAIAREVGLENVTVIAPATHDTASAVAAAPIDGNTAYISSGTWSLVGIETGQPIISDLAAAENFTNEGGVYGTFRFLKNVMGLWIFESCRREWEASGMDVGYDSLLDGLRGDQVSDPLIFVDDPAFLNPASMIDAVAAQLQATGQRMPETPMLISRMIFDSLALRYASVLRSIERISGRKLKAIEILGGGGRNSYLNQMTADASGLDVYAGLTEATVTGNALVQAISLGRFSAIDEGRGYVREKVPRRRFATRERRDIEAIKQRYMMLEARFTIGHEAPA